MLNPILLYDLNISFQSGNIIKLIPSGHRYLRAQEAKDDDEVPVDGLKLPPGSEEGILRATQWVKKHFGAKAGKLQQQQQHQQQQSTIG